VVDKLIVALFCTVANIQMKTRTITFCTVSLCCVVVFFWLVKTV
jgi:hypothetical protein